MKTHQVVIVGAGPTGMMLAAELTLAGIDVVVIERRRTPELSGARAGGRGIHPRTLEIFDMRGIVDRFLAEGQKAQTVGFNGVHFDIGDFPTRHPYGLALLQKHTERIMAAWIEELGVRVLRDREVTGFVQDANQVTVAAGGDRLGAEYLIGCDGGKSIVRKLAGIDFLGWDASMSWLIAEAKMTGQPQFGFKEDAVGVHAMGPLEDRIGLVLTEPAVRTTSERTLDDLKAGLVAVYGTDFGVHSPNFISSFTDAARQASAYRKGRVLLAGDAAHVHAPLGGMGLNTGVQDAVNLGWKLAEVITRRASDALLDSYQAERHPVAARVLRNTVAHAALRRTDDRTKVLSEYVTEFLQSTDARRRLAGEMSGLAIRYDLGDGHPLLGRRMPDLEIDTARGTLRVYSLLRRPEALVVTFNAPGALSVDHVRAIDASYQGRWELPAIGDVPAPAAVLIRPDGYVGAVASSEQRS